MNNDNSEYFSSILEEELTTSGDTLKQVLRLYEKEGGIHLCDSVDSHTLISVVANLISLAEEELHCYKLRQDYPINQPRQKCVSIFCARFLMDLYRASDYKDVFDSLQNISDSLPSIDYYDDIGLSDLDELSNYKKLFLQEAVSILQFHINRLKEEILATDLVPRDIAKDLNLFSSGELISRIDKKLQSLEFEECLPFLCNVRETFMSYLDLFERTKDTLDGQMEVSIRSSEAQRYWFSIRGGRFSKIERSSQDINTVLHWISAKIASIETHATIQAYQTPMIRLGEYKHLEMIRGCFQELHEAGIINHMDMMN
jgi:hypothetical protein